MLLQSFSFSTVFTLALGLPSPAVGARNPRNSHMPNCSIFHQHTSWNMQQSWTVPISLLSDDGYGKMRPFVHARRRIKQEQASPVEILQRLRGGGLSDTTSSSKVHLLIETLDIFGTAIFAFSGALKAGRKGMDLIGMMIIACITATGGGTLRDVLMMGGGEEHVVFWMQTPLYIEISLFTALLTFYLWPKLEAKFGFKVDSAIPICASVYYS